MAANRRPRPPKPSADIPPNRGLEGEYSFVLVTIFRNRRPHIKNKYYTCLMSEYSRREGMTTVAKRYAQNLSGSITRVTYGPVIIHGLSLQARNELVTYLCTGPEKNKEWTRKAVITLLNDMLFF